MSARFVRLHHAGQDGRPTLINTASIEQVSRGEDNGSVVFFVGEGADGCIQVQESLDEIAALLNGESRHVCGQLHPDITDIRAMPVKAHPEARPWQFHDIQKGGQ